VRVTTALDGHITVDEKGVARIAGSRMKVIDLVMEKAGSKLTPEDLHREFPHLLLAQIYAALTYYHDHQAELDTQIQESIEFADRMRAAAGPSPLAERLRQAGKLP
jgi:uncharacterized protein (DUF433 family)